MGVDGRAGVDNSQFSATVYNGSGFDLSELVFKVMIFESDKAKMEYEEKGASSKVKPKVRLLRIKQSHPNQTVTRYTSPIDEPAVHWSWDAVDGKGLRVPGVPTAWEAFVKEYQEEEQKTTQSPKQQEDDRPQTTSTSLRHLDLR